MSVSETIADERAVRGTSSPILGMVLFVASEAMFFAAFFGVYFTIRASQSSWPPKGIEAPKLGIPSVATVLLVTSSFVLQAGVRAIQRGQTRRLERLLAATIVMGLGFLVLQVWDYSRSPFGIRSGIFPSLFYVMTSLHLAHVAGGVVFLSMILAQSRTGQLSLERHEPVEAGAIYWHFVDVVWIGLFTAFYLLTR
ncbi:MAG: heme-copper oxidase subunit III [Actinobacteria bacterium]|nr:MAG: heme-copper oxidase subunit III [Actinomycetota bacterium]